jgi:hypothetical protein
MSDPSRSGEGPVVRLLGAMLMAVGCLITVLSGLCSLAFIGTTVLNTPASALSLIALATAMIMGGLPMCMGIGLFVVGRDLFRGRR